MKGGNEMTYIETLGSNAVKVKRYWQLPIQERKIRLWMKYPVRLLKIRIR